MTISTEGDLGDACYLLSIIADIPNGPHKLLLTPSLLTKMRTPEQVEAFERLFKPLAEAQTYISECRITRPDDKIDWKSAEFRNAPYFGSTLLYAHTKHLIQTHNIGHDSDGRHKWLGALPSKESKDRIIINRTGRYRNWHFPWAEIVKFYKHRLLFVGVEHEWREFCSHFGYVDFRPTTSLQEVAELIAGSLQFIGNQSCANAIAEGLKHNLIQETALDFPDCVFKRANAQHVFDGKCTLPGFEGAPDRKTEPLSVSTQHLDTKTVPPGKMVNGRRTQAGWILDLPGGKREIQMHFNVIVSIAKQHGLTREDVLDQNARWNYDYFFKGAHSAEFMRAEAALRTAGITPNHP